MVWGGGVHHSKDPILARFLSRYACASSCLNSIGIGARFCVKPSLVPGGVLTLKHCGVETHGIRKWYPPPPEEAFLFQEGGIAFS